MLILLVFFASISAIHCAVVHPPPINYTISRIDDVAVVDCDTKFGYNPSNGYFRQLITEVEVLRIRNCSKNIIPSLGLLFFAWNKIELSNLDWKTLDLHTFFGHNGLNKLSADHNELETLPKGIFGHANLSFLDLSFNQFQTIESIAEAGVTHLETLIISHNNIVTINDTTFKNFGLLKMLDLSFNHLTNIGYGTFDLIPKLNHLSMANNNLTSLKFTIFTHLRLLKSLDISKNHLKSIEISSRTPVFQHLERINIESNQIKYIESLTSINPVFSVVPNLRYVNLLNNRFTCVYIGQFFSGYDLTKLEYAMDESAKVTSQPSFRGILCALN